LNTDVRLDHRMISVDHDERLHLMLELTAPEHPGNGRAPLGIALVVDRSGSMDGAKLAAARACAVWLAERLVVSDLLALVSFDHDVAVHVPAEPAASGRVAHEAAQLRARPPTSPAGGSKGSRYSTGCPPS